MSSPSKISKELSDKPNPDISLGVTGPAGTKKKEKKKKSKGFRASLRKLFSSGKAKSPSEPAPPRGHEVEAIPVAPRKRIPLTMSGMPILSKVTLCSEAIDIFEILDGFIGSSEPTPPGEILSSLTEVVQILKVVVEAKQVWRTRFVSIEQRQMLFAAEVGQLDENRLERQSNSLTAAIREYVDSLQSVSAKAMEAIGMLERSAIEEKRCTRIHLFINRRLLQESTEGVEACMLQLLDKIDALQRTLFGCIGETMSSVETQGPLIDMRAKKLDDFFIVHQGINIHDMNAFGTQHSSCMKGTRTDVLEKIQAWYRVEGNKTPVYCLEDAAGTGKSTIARTLVQEWSEGECLAFFFPNSPVQGPTDFCFFLAQRIKACCSSLELDEYWDPISSGLSQLRTKEIGKQWDQLVYEPLRKCTRHSRHVLVIDALDQCDERSRNELLKCLLNTSSPSRSGPNLRILITTRSEPTISNTLLESIDNDALIHKKLRDSTNVLKDIASYVNHSLDEANIFPSDPQQRAMLIDGCQESFILAVVACKLLAGADSGNRPLNEILGDFISLDSLYYQVLSRAASKPTATMEVLKDILRAILAAQEPLSMTSISALLSIPTEQVLSIVKELEPILVSGQKDDAVHFRHATVADYLTSSKRGDKTTDNEWYITREEGNLALAMGCFSILQNELKTNLSNMISPTPPIAEDYEIMKNKIRTETTASLQYAAIAWIVHVASVLNNQQICSEIRRFFQQKLLNWLEFGGISRCLPYFLLCLRHLRSAMGRAHGSPNKLIIKDDLQWCNDTIEFLLCNQTLLEAHPLHIYSSSLAFSLWENRVHQQYLPLVHQQVPKVLWGDPRLIKPSQALIGHTENVHRVAYSSEGDFLVTATWGGEMIVWDAQSGLLLSIFRLADVKWGCLALGFLPGNTVIMSIWEDGRLYRFSRETMQLICPPEDMKVDTRWARIAWTKDWTRLACGTRGGKVHHFRLGTKLEIGNILEAHDMEINTVSFSCDNQKMACTSADKTFSIWNVDSGWPTFFWRNSAAIWDGAFSPTDSSLFAFVDGKSLSIYDVTRKTLIFKATGVSPKAMVFSHSGDQIAAHAERSVHIVELYKNDKEHDTMRPGSEVNPRRRMASSPMMLKLDTGPVSSMAFSPDGSLLATGGWDSTPRVHNLKQAYDHKIRNRHESRVRYISFSHNGQRLASVDVEGRVCIWSTEGGTLVKNPIRTEKKNTVVALSPDGLVLAFAADMGDVRFWDVEREKPVGARVSIGNAWEMDVKAMTFSPSGIKLALTAGRPQSSIIAILHVKGILEAAAIPAVTTKVSPSLLSKHLAFHPSGECICCGDYVWCVTSSELTPASRESIPEILGQALPAFVRFEYPYMSPLPSMSVGSPTRQVFYLPTDIGCYTCSIHDGLVAVGSDDGRVTVFDLTHLLTQSEVSARHKLIEMRTHESSRHGFAIYDTLSAHSEPFNLLVTM